MSIATLQPSRSLIWIGTIIDFNRGKSPCIPILILLSFFISKSAFGFQGLEFVKIESINQRLNLALLTSFLQRNEEKD